jgi:hypothetical protein
LYEADPDSLRHIGDELLVNLRYTPVSYYVNLAGLIDGYVGDYTNLEVVYFPTLPIYERYFSATVTVADSFYVGRRYRPDHHDDRDVVLIHLADSLYHGTKHKAIYFDFTRISFGEPDTVVGWKYQIGGPRTSIPFLFPILAPPDTSVSAGDTTVIIPYEEFIKTGSKTIRESEVTYSMPEITWPMTADLYIKAKVKHRQSIKSIDGSISGMADGFRVSHINRTSESGTLRFYPEMFENFKLGEDADSMGLITVRVPTFGLPFGKELLEQREDGDNILTFHVTLVNDSIHHESFRVGKQIRYITPEGKEAQVRYREDLRNLLLEIDLSETIVVPIAEKPVGAGFDAKVDDWEDGGSIDIGL